MPDIKKNTINEAITPEHIFNQRRQFMGKVAGVTGAALLSRVAWSQTQELANDLIYEKSALPVNEALTPRNIVTKLNNFYEFGLGKNDPLHNAHTMKTHPWQIVVEGEVHKPKTFDMDELLKLSPLEERIYRLRCVEAWSMVVPWIGYSLRELIHQVQPTGNAKYVEFVSLADPEQMPGLKSRVLDWPYTEALRMDEAMNDLTLLCFGVYGQVLPNQNGAPVRVIVPWKYGFKSGKSIVRIRFLEHMPQTSWMRANPREYGFYANVNPNVPHPRWSQASETRINESGQRVTRMFNGYEEQVASMYSGMDLAKYF